MTFHDHWMSIDIPSRFSTPTENFLMSTSTKQNQVIPGAITAKNTISLFLGVPSTRSAGE
jgi:hypothetical protein